MQSEFLLHPHVCVSQYFGLYCSHRAQNNFLHVAENLADRSHEKDIEFKDNIKSHRDELSLSRVPERAPETSTYSSSQANMTDKL